jgi:three-Cys-motif partner protein
MSPSQENKWVISSGDGLRARKNGAWAKEKLSFLDEFVPAALQATGGGKHPKQQRWYIDLFAGPGRNVDERSGEEFEGSAIRVLPMSATVDKRVHFTHATIVNKNAEDHAALLSRVERLRATGRIPVPRANVKDLLADANQVVHRVIKEVDPRAYVLVVADITAPKQLPWSTVKALRSHGHQSVDLYMLFPLGMAINRMLSFNTETVEQSARVLTDFFGTEDWRPLVEGRRTNAQSPELRRDVLELYLSRLRGLGWAYAFVARDVQRVGEADLYKMLYASNHPAGGSIASWSANKGRSGDQRELF